jgi:hypothetical protein
VVVAVAIVAEVTTTTTQFAYNNSNALDFYDDSS